MICPKCGKRVPAEKEICPICGEKMHAKAEKKISKKTWGTIISIAVVVVIFAVIGISAAVSTARTHNDNKILQLINDAYKDSTTFDRAELVEDSVVIYLVAPEGTAGSVQAGGESVQAAWKEMAVGLGTATANIEALLAEEGFEDYSAVICLLSDINNDNMLLRIDSGVITYSVLELN